MNLPIEVTMDNGMEITLIRRDGTGTMDGLSQKLYFRAWQASTKSRSITAFGSTEDAAIASLLNKVQEA